MKLDIKTNCLRLMVVATLGLTACADNLGLNESNGSEGMVDFSAQINPMSRISGSGWEGNEIVGMKVDHTLKTYMIADASGKLVTEDDPYRWKDEAYSLLAWTPLTNEDILLNNQTTTENFYHCDLLACRTDVNAKQVNLAFSHKMARVWWQLQVWQEGYSDEEAENAQVYFYGYEKVKFTEGEIVKEGEPSQWLPTCKTSAREGELMMVPCEMWGKQLIKVVIGGDTHIYTPDANNPDQLSKKTGVLCENTYARYYLKVSKKGLTIEKVETQADWTEGSVGEIIDGQMKTSIDNSVTSLTDYQVKGISEGVIADMKEGFTISFTEKGMGGLSYEGICEMTRSTEGTTHTYSFKNVASDIRIAYVDEYVAVGDYYYSDGTWGSAESKDGCTTLGRVFKTGAHPSDSPANYGDNWTKIRGYVICTALTSPAKASWLADAAGTYKDELDKLEGLTDADRTNQHDYLGYQLTKGIKKALNGYETMDTDFPFWHAFLNAGVTDPTSGTNSGWYIPSIAQLADLKASKMSQETEQCWSSNVYAERGGESINRIWALDYNMSSGAVGTCWTSDPRKMILILTF